MVQHLLLQQRFRASVRNLLILFIYCQPILVGSQRLKSLVITVHVVQHNLLNFTDCFYMLSVKVLVRTALSLVCVVVYVYNLSAWFVVGSLLLKPASLGSILEVPVKKGKVWRFL